jgi:AraC-like DNA-binding protein
LYDFCVADDTRIRAWRPRVPGVAEVLHAHMTSHVYPMHTHESWTLLIVDDGMVRYDLHHHEHGAREQVVTLLPPHVPHNGRAATSAGFRKRVIYLDLSQLPTTLIGPAVSQPLLPDPLLRQRIHQLHRVLGQAGEEFEAENRLAFIAERLRRHLAKPESQPDEAGVAPPATVADGLRDLMDTSFRDKVTLRDAAGTLHAHPAHLVRMFSRKFGISPHQYVTGRRVDLARRLLLDGMPPSQAAVEAGFYDQSHLSRHFTAVVGTSPGRYARSANLSRWLSKLFETLNRKDPGCALQLRRRSSDHGGSWGRTGDAQLRVVEQASGTGRTRLHRVRVHRRERRDHRGTAARADDRLRRGPGHDRHHVLHRLRRLRARQPQ